MAEAVRSAGHSADVWVFGESPFGISGARSFDKPRLLADPEYRWDMFDEAIRNFDVFHFMAGHSLLDAAEPTMPILWDLPLLRLLGKKVVMHFRGSEVRMPSIHLEREPDSYFKNMAQLPDEGSMQSRISVTRRHADTMLVSTPGLLDYVPDAEWVGHVVSPVGSTLRQGEPTVPHVVHIPSNPVFKGTESIVKSMDSLAQKGAITFELLQGISVTEVHDKLAQADMLIDSIAIGDHGLISVEAMARGCIAVAHIASVNRERNPGTPVVEATGESLGEVVAALAGDPDRRAQLRVTGIEWVSKRHSLETVGKQLAEIYSRPRSFPDTHRPDWPTSSGTAHVRDLERRLEEYESDGHSLFAGHGAPSRTVTPNQVERLSQRILELEAAMSAGGLEPPDPVTGGWIRQYQPSRRSRLFKYPRVHLLLRRLNQWRS